MFSVLLSRLIILLFGTLYPAYGSYKAIRTKCVKEYIKWMMYWIVFAFFTFIETFTDIFCSWFPFYYEIKIVILLWLLSPATKGSSTLYRKFVHPMLKNHEEEIDQYISEAKERGYSVVFQLGTRGVNYATNVIMQTAIKGGGNIVQTFKKSYSLSDISETDSIQPSNENNTKVVARQAQQRVLRPRAQAALTRSASGSRHSTGMYFSEANVIAKKSIEQSGNVRSAEDISSGYSSGDPHSLATAVSTTTMKTRGRGRRGEMMMVCNGMDFDEYDETSTSLMGASIDEEQEQTDGEEENHINVKMNEAEQLCSSYTELLTTPHHCTTTNMYTIDAQQMLNLIRFMDYKNDNNNEDNDGTSRICEIHESTDVDDITENFVDCTNTTDNNNSNTINKDMPEVLRKSTKKRRAPAPPIVSPPTIDNQKFMCEESASLKPFDDSEELDFRPRSKSDLSATSRRSLLKGFFRMKNQP